MKSLKKLTIAIGPIPWVMFWAEHSVDAVDLVGLHGGIVAEGAEEVVAPAARALLAAHRGPLLAAEVAHQPLSSPELL